MSVIIPQSSFPEYPLWECSQNKRALSNFDLEIKTRGTNDCRHCGINKSAEDVALGTLGCPITGGELLLRSDFKDI
jgi:hypothetical protein